MKGKKWTPQDIDGENNEKHDLGFIGMEAMMA